MLIKTVTFGFSATEDAWVLFHAIQSIAEFLFHTRLYVAAKIQCIEI